MILITPPSPSDQHREHASRFTNIDLIWLLPQELPTSHHVIILTISAQCLNRLTKMVINSCLHLVFHVSVLEAQMENSFRIDCLYTPPLRYIVSSILKLEKFWTPTSSNLYLVNCEGQSLYDHTWIKLWGLIKSMLSREAQPILYLCTRYFVPIIGGGQSDDHMGICSRTYKDSCTNAEGGVMKEGKRYTFSK